MTTEEQQGVLLLLASASSDVLDAVLTREIPTEQRDQHEMGAYLVLLQQQMTHAAAAADEVARVHSFALYREGKRANTLRRHRADVACFMHYLDEAGVAMSETCERLGTHMYDDPRLWRHVTFGLLLGFRKWQLRRGYAVESVNARLSTIKIYGGLASRAGYIPAEELLSIQQVKRVRLADAEQIDEQRPVTRIGKKQADPVQLDAMQLQRLFPARPATAQQWRDLLALRFLYDMALRPGEAIRVTVGDINVQEGTMAVYRNKTRLRQRLPLSKGTLLALTNYLPLVERLYKERLGDQYPRLALLIRTRKDGDLDERLALPETTGPIIAWSTQAMHSRVRELGARIGIANLYPYCARHQWAQGVVKAKNDMVTAAKFGGWRADSKMLARYYGDEEIVSPVHLPWE